MARPKQPAPPRTKEDVSVKVEDTALVPTENEAPIETVVPAEDESPVLVANEAPIEIQVEAPAEVEALVAVEADDARALAEDTSPHSPELGDAQLPSVTTAAPNQAASFNTIVVEMTDYSKRSLENTSAFVKKLLGAKSFESAIHIQSEYTKSSYTDFVAYVTKIGEIYSKLAKETFERRSHVA